MTAQLETRAKHYAKIITIILERQGLTGGRIVSASRGARHLSLALRLADTTELDKALKLSESVAMASNVQAVLAARQAGQLVYQFQLNPGFWQSYTRADLPSPGAVGLGERRKPVDFTFEQPHALIAGTSGSGKTEATKTALVSLMATHEPAALGVVLVNPKRDMLPDFDNAAHLVTKPAYTAEESRAAIAYVADKLRRRTEGEAHDQRLLLVIDEPDLVGIEGATLAHIQTIAKIGRSFGVHLLISTQKPTHTELPKILDNLLNRFVGLVSDAGISATLTGKAGLQAHRLTGKGDFLHIEGPEITRFQVAMATATDFERLPRAEAGPIPAVETEPLTRLPDVATEPDNGGRPRLEVDPCLLAYYFYHHPDKISHKTARQVLNLTRTGHERHREFCREFIKCYLELKQQRKMIGA